VKETVTADIDNLTREVKSEPADLLYSLSYGYLVLDQEKKSRELLLRLVTLFPDAEYTARAVREYAVEAYERKFSDEVQKEVRGLLLDLVKRRPETKFARDMLAALASDKDVPLEVTEAICQKWIEAEPDNPHPYLNRAIAY
jgi:hypothetical protein